MFSFKKAKNCLIWWAGTIVSVCVFPAGLEEGEDEGSRILHLLSCLVGALLRERVLGFPGEGVMGSAPCGERSLTEVTF